MKEVIDLLIMLPYITLLYVMFVTKAYLPGLKLVSSLYFTCRAGEAAQ